MRFLVGTLRSRGRPIQMAITWWRGPVRCIRWIKMERPLPWRSGLGIGMTPKIPNVAMDVAIDPATGTVGLIDLLGGSPLGLKSLDW